MRGSPTHLAAPLAAAVLVGAMLGAGGGVAGAGTAGAGAAGAGPAGRSAGSSTRPGPAATAAPVRPADPVRVAAQRAAAADPVLVGAGDVASCDYTADSRTAKLLDGIAGHVFVAGDLAYPDGTAAQFRDCYDPTWGRFRDRTSPVPGNHEYHTRGAAPYFAYFGASAGTKGEGWYAYDLGTWRIYSLNANCAIVGCAAGSAQRHWLKADLAAHPRACVAAIWHQPLFSSGFHGNTASVRPLWRALEAAGADLVINGHDHDYERFRRQTSTGVASRNGIREFVVGTGGAALRPFAKIRANSVVRHATAHGVLKLTLRSGGYGWRFVPTPGHSWTDTGSAACR